MTENRISKDNYLTFEKSCIILKIMSLNKNNFFIGVLISSLLLTSLSPFLIEIFTKIKTECFVEEQRSEKMSDEYIFTYINKNTFRISFLKRDIYIQPIYTYHNIKSFNKPPIV